MENSKIEWTDHTYNPWNRECEAAGRRDRVFSLSLGDWLDLEVNPAWLADLLGIIAKTPHLDWLLLTKRIEHWRQRLEAAEKATQDEEVASLIFRWLEGVPPENVWLGATVENQAVAEKRIPLLLDLPAKIRFISVEPLLESIKIWPYIKTFESDEGTCGYEPHQLDWIICGGESGRNARAFNLEWARSLKAQAESIGASFFMKQCGENCWDGDRRWYCRGAGKSLGDLPEDLRIRQIPSLVTD